MCISMLEVVGIKMLQDVGDTNNDAGKYRCCAPESPLRKEETDAVIGSISLELEAEGGWVVVLGMEEDCLMPCWTRRS